ncbi:aldehyde dehydrogenase family protein [Sphaerisporangium corydalis]|uniref:Aldehyde dehydrogenase family protein n=1 Tax=Sphaerisporangium corydalis TaxID=1441875 RepID=A0ABV9ER99_9ACTN|nr:aldehyde dehydrogenase family protein [Sphaerisporangium corydalis]
MTMTTNRTERLPVRQAIIGGEHIEASDSFDDLDPSTGLLCARVARCGTEEIDLAVTSARSAFESDWRRTSPADRANACRRMAAVLRAHRGELAELETLDTGKPIRQAYVDADVAARYFEFYAGCAEALFGDTLLSTPDLFAYTLPEPHGVCGHIVPWNYPLQVSARTIAPALAAGNCCVLKPAEEAPLTALRLGDLALEAGFPPGVLNVVPGYGAEAGAALSAHDGLDHLAFTGSRAVGEMVMTSAAKNIVPVTLELGGKSPHILFPDFEPERAIQLIVASIVEHAGQNCSAGSRVLVHEDIHDMVVAALVEVFKMLRIGAGRTDPDVGPVISAKQRSRVLDYIERGRRDSRLVTGGGLPDDPELGDGFFVQPTIFDDVPPGSDISHEEIFGPVLCVTGFSDADEAIALANGTPYGLSAGVWTQNVGLAQRLIRELRVGQVFVNNYSAAGAVELPFGGYKKSGFGREKGFQALREYTRCKAVAIRVGSE